MPRCSKCGRHGWFLQLNSYGICESCFELEVAEKQAAQEAKIRQLEELRARRLSYFRKNIYPTEPKNDSIKSAWFQWDSHVHDSDSQLDRQLQSVFEAIPISIEEDNLSGIFINWTETELYRTSLSSCSCNDFKTSSLPCCHMYRLFADLNSTDRSIIFNLPRNLISKFSLLSDEQKLDFIVRLQYLDSNGKDRFACDNLAIEIDVGLFRTSESVNYAPLLNKMTKDEIVLSLRNNGIYNFKYSWSKVMLIAWVIDTQQTYLREHFKNYVHITADPCLIQWGTAIADSRAVHISSHPHFWKDACKDVI